MRTGNSYAAVITPQVALRCATDDSYNILVAGRMGPYFGSWSRYPGVAGSGLLQDPSVD